MEETNAQIKNEPKYQVNQQLVNKRIENMKLEQNLALGIIGGGLCGLAGATIWAAVTYFTEYQIGWLAVGVGFLVGFGMSRMGKGLDKIFGVAGGVIALVSVLLGNFLASIGFLAKYFEVNFLDMLINFNYSLTLELMMETFSIMDILFYGIAIYEGYRFSFRKINQKELLEGALTKIETE